MPDGSPFVLLAGHPSRFADFVRRFFLWSLAWLSDFTFAMHREFVLSFVWVATASGSAWYEPLLGGVKLPSTELDRLGKDLELMSHKVLCFIAFLPSA